MTTDLGDLSVGIVPDLSAFEDGVISGVTDVMGKVSSEITTGLDDATTQAAQSAIDNLSSGFTQAGTDAAGAFGGTLASGVQESIDSIGNISAQSLGDSGALAGEAFGTNFDEATSKLTTDSEQLVLSLGDAGTLAADAFSTNFTPTTSVDDAELISTLAGAGTLSGDEFSTNFADTVTSQMGAVPVGDIVTGLADAGTLSGDGFGTNFADTVTSQIGDVATTAGDQMTLDLTQAGSAAGDAFGGAFASSSQDSMAAMQDSVGTLDSILGDAGTTAGDGFSANFDETVTSQLGDTAATVGDQMTSSLSDAGAQAGTGAASGFGSNLASGVAGEIAGNMSEGAGAAASAGAGLGEIAGGAFGVYFGVRAVKAYEDLQKQTQLLAFGLQKVWAGPIGKGMVQPLLDFAFSFAQATASNETDIVKLEATLANLGKTTLLALGPAGATKAVEDLTSGLINMAAGTQKPLAMMMRTLGPMIFNTPASAVSQLVRNSTLTAEQGSQVKALVKDGQNLAATQFIITAMQLRWNGAAQAALTPMAQMHAKFLQIETDVGKRFSPVMNAAVYVLKSIGPGVYSGVVAFGVLATSILLITKVAGIASKGWDSLWSGIVKIGQGVEGAVGKITSAYKGTALAQTDVAISGDAVAASSIGQYAAATLQVGAYERLAYAEEAAAAAQKALDEANLAGVADQAAVNVLVKTRTAALVELKAAQEGAAEADQAMVVADEELVVANTGLVASLEALWAMLAPALLIGAILATIVAVARLQGNLAAITKTTHEWTASVEAGTTSLTAMYAAAQKSDATITWAKNPIEKLLGLHTPVIANALGIHPGLSAANSTVAAVAADLTKAGVSIPAPPVTTLGRGGRGGPNPNVRPTYTPEYIKAISDAETAHIAAVNALNDAQLKAADSTARLKINNDSLNKTVDAATKLWTKIPPLLTVSTDAATAMMAGSVGLAGAVDTSTAAIRTDVQAMKAQWNSTAVSMGSHIDLVTAHMNDLESKTHLTAAMITKSFDSNLKATESYAKNITKISHDTGVGAQQLAQQLGPNMAAVIASATPEVRKHIENDITKSTALATKAGGSLETQMVGAFKNVAAAVIVMSGAIDTATGSAYTFQGALDKINGTKVSATVDLQFISHRPARAAGGPVFPGENYMVGEHGPEMFQPSMPGNILTHTETIAASVQAQGVGHGGRQPVRLVVDGDEFAAYIEEVGANQAVARSRGAQ